MLFNLDIFLNLFFIVQKLFLNPVKYLPTFLVDFYITPSSLYQVNLVQLN